MVDCRFRADKSGQQYWSTAANHCAIPGRSSATLTTTTPTGGLPLGSGGKALAAAFTSPHLAAVPAPQGQSTTLVERTIDYTYAPLNRLTAAAYSTGESYVYQYDAAGNRTAYTLTTPLDGTAVTTYTYDAANRLLVAGAPGHAVAYTWDARGNLLADGTFTYTYNAAGQMARAESITATLVYTYNADGLRVAQAQSVSSVQSVDTFTWDWATSVPELLSDGESLYLTGYDTLGWQNGADWTFVLPDALGSVRQETDATGAVVRAREWSPYGEEVGGAQAGLGYTGEWFDANVGLQYLRARWYDGTTGRFTSMDPWEGDIHIPISLQGYVYADNAPIIWVDPSGYKPKSIDEIGDIRDEMDTLVDIGKLEVGYQYSCNCGWIDWGHALSGMQSKDSLAYRILKPLEAHIAWENYPTAMRSNRVVFIESRVGKRVGKYVFSVPIKTEYAVVPEENLNSSHQRHSIAASIFVRHSIHVEDVHASFGRLTDSGYSEEDLPSNLIGLYMTLQIDNGKDYRAALEEVLQLCRVMDGEASKSVYTDIYQNGDLFIEDWTRWDARLVPTVLADPCKFSQTCSAPGRWPAQFSSLYLRAQMTERQGSWRWLSSSDPGLVPTNVENLFLLRQVR